MNFFNQDAAFVKWLGLFFLCMCMALGHVGIMTVPFALPGLLIDVRHRTICASFLTICGLAVCLGWTILFPFLMIKLGNYAFMVFAGVLVVNLVYAWIFVKLN